MNKPTTKVAPVITLSPVKSSNIAAHGYDAATQTLAVKFSSGAVYHYENVPPVLVDRLKKSKSVGAFFASDIRSKFKGAKQP